MKRLLATIATAIGIAAGAYAATIDLSTVNQSYLTLRNGDEATGTLGINCKVMIQAGADICLSGATINGTNSDSAMWAGITCLGDATIRLKGANKVKGFHQDYPGILVPTGSTLTIQNLNSGSLEASSNGRGAGIGGGYQIGCGSIVVESGEIMATGGFGAAAIGGGYGVPCGAIAIRGGTITASGGELGSGIGCGGYDPDLNKRGTCIGVYIYETVCCVTASTVGSNPSISSVHSDATWVDRRFTTITENPFIYRGMGVNLSLLEEDYTARNGDVITGEAGRTVTIPAGATVTVNGVTVTGAAGGTVLPAPEFAADGDAATTKFVPGENGKWTLTTFAELANDALGADVADGQVKVYAADTIEGLKTASPMTGGVEIKEKKSAVKTTIEVTPADPTDPAQFFKVKFGE